MNYGLFLEQSDSLLNLHKIEIQNFQLRAIVFIYLSYFITIPCCFIDYKNNYDIIFNKKNIQLYTYFFIILTIFSYIIVSNNFISIYVGIEAYSIIMYVILGLHNTKKFSSSIRITEVALKYLIASFIGSIVFLTGVAFCFVSFGDLTFSNYSFISYSAVEHSYSFNLSKKFSLGTVIIGLCIKLGLAPYHSWINGTYDSFSTKIFHFSIVYPKFVFFIIIFNIFLGYPQISLISSHFENFFIFLGVINLFVGTFSASKQTNIKRLLIYSSIANSGYIFMSLGSDSINGFSTINYLYIYFFIINFFFIVFFNLYEKNAYSYDKTWTIANFSNIKDGFFKFALTIAIMNFSGMPPFLAFFGKLPIIFNFVCNHKFICAFIVIIFSVLSAYYSVRMIMHIWFFNDVKNNYKINKINKEKKIINMFDDESADWGYSKKTTFTKKYEILRVVYHLFNDINFGINNSTALTNWPIKLIKVLIKFGIIISFLGAIIVYVNYTVYLHFKLNK